MHTLQETVLYVAQRLSRLSSLNKNDIYLTCDRNGADKIPTLSSKGELEKFIENHASRKFYFLNIGHGYDAWDRVRNPVRTGINGLICLHLADLFWPDVKNYLYKRVGVNLGKKVNIAPTAVLDFMFPELIEIGDYCTIGGRVELLTHELCEDVFMIGEIKVGEKSEIGSSSRIMPGIYVGKNAVVGSHALVTRDVPDGKTVGGVPARELNQPAD